MEAVTAALDWALDGLLALTLLWLGWRVLASADLFKGIAFFIAFGLVMALIWVRLEAPDVAIAEAAIGAGLTGALLLAALSRLRQDQGAAAADAPAEDPAENPAQDRAKDPAGARTGGRRRGTHAVLVGLSALLFVGLGGALLSLPTEAPGMSAPVAENLSTSGVSNPVTAVLLNFRAYDTLLEKAVLLLAVVAAWSLSMAPREPVSSPGRVLDVFVRLLLPLMIVVANYLLWVGAHAPGGAFQAGAVLAAVAVLLLLSGKSLPAGWEGWPLRALLTLGLGVFIAVGAAVMFFGYRFLEYPPDQAGNLILLIEVVATVSIAVALATLFMGGRPRRGEPG